MLSPNKPVPAYVILEAGSLHDLQKKVNAAITQYGLTPLGPAQCAFSVHGTVITAYQTLIRNYVC